MQVSLKMLVVSILTMSNKPFKVWAHSEIWGETLTLSAPVEHSPLFSLIARHYFVSS
jgi:hypothetical protein